MTEGWTSGNAADDGAAHRGWLVGNFLDPAATGIRASDDVEVKWGVHPAGDQRAGWATDDQRTTLVLLVYGRFRIDLSDGTSIMQRQGDYVMWGPGIDHTWQALADSVVITVRWPSVDSDVDPR